MSSVEPFLQRVRVCHHAEPGAFVPWHAGGASVGRVHRDRVGRLLQAPSPFVQDAGRLVLVGEDFAARSAAIAGLVQALAGSGEFGAPVREFYPVTAAAGDAPLLQIDRVAVPWFGVRAAGVHLTGWVRAPSGIEMWVARRARGKRTFPGHLDNLVAGGQSIGQTTATTLQKECHEEAGIGADLAGRAVQAGGLRYEQQDGKSLKVDTLACFELELPADFVPHPVDGEVESFERWPLAAVAASLRRDDAWKPNSALVALDFLLRHGGLDGELSPPLRQRLRQALHEGRV